MNDVLEIRSPEEVTQYLFKEAKEQATIQSKVVVIEKPFDELSRMLGGLGKKIGEGNQMQVFEWKRHPHDVAKIGQTSEVLVEAICLSIIREREIIVSPIDGESIGSSIKALVLSPRIKGINHLDLMRNITRSKKHSVLDKEKSRKEFTQKAVVAVAEAIAKSEQHRISLNDIQLRQVNHDESGSSEWTDFSAARVVWYDTEMVGDIIEQLEILAAKPRASVNDKVRVKKMKRALSKAISNFRYALKEAGVKDDLLEYSQDELFFVANSLRHGSSDMARVAQSIDSAARVTLINILSDFFSGQDKMGNWSSIETIINDSLLEIFTYFQDGELLSEVLDPHQYAEVVVERLKSAFIFTDPDRDEFDYSSLKDEVVSSLESSMSRRDAVKVIINKCISSDKIINESINRDWSDLKKEIGSSSLGEQQKLYMVEAIDFFVSQREKLDILIKGEANSLQSGWSKFSKYLAVRDKAFSLQQEMSSFLVNYFENTDQNLPYEEWEAKVDNISANV